MSTREHMDTSRGVTTHERRTFLVALSVALRGARVGVDVLLVTGLDGALVVFSCSRWLLRLVATIALLLFGVKVEMWNGMENFISLGFTIVLIGAPRTAKFRSRP